MSRRTSKVSDIVDSPSENRDDEGESIRRPRMLAVSRETEAMDIVSGEVAIDCRV